MRHTFEQSGLRTIAEVIRLAHILDMEPADLIARLASVRES